MTHYFDHAATTPVRPAAVRVWQEQASRVGNPAAIHGAGRAARRVVEESRETIGQILGVDPATVLFTSGGTEADNLAVLGIARARRRADPRRRLVLVSPIEHPAVLEAARGLVREGFTVEEMPLTERGWVNPAATADLMRLRAGELALVSLMAVNNETGVLQPAARLAEVARRELGVPFHCDLVQSQGWGPDQTPPLHGCANLPEGFGPPAPGDCVGSYSAHKLGGPMGIGALVVPRGTALEPIGFGGGQEARLRSGTQPVALIGAFAQALREAWEERSAEGERLVALSQRLDQILASVGARIVGADGPRTPAITYALFPGCLGQDLVTLLDARGVFVSVGSACAAGVPQPSHVLLAMGLSEDEARSGLRFSLGWTSSDEDLDALAALLPEAVERAGGAPASGGSRRVEGSAGVRVPPRSEAPGRSGGPQESGGSR